MKIKAIREILLVSVFLAGLCGISRASTVIVSASTQPSLGGDDIASFSGTGAISNYQDFTNQALPGQVFTTGSNAAGYLLNSITLQGSGNAGGGYSAATYTITIYSVSSEIMTGDLSGTHTSYSGETLTPLDGGSFTYTFANTTDNFSKDYLTFTLPSLIALDPNAQYAFTITVPSAGGSWYGLQSSYSNDPQDVYDGGYAFNMLVADDGTLGALDRGYDRNFGIELEAIPEPASWVLMGFGIGTLVLLRRKK